MTFPKELSIFLEITRIPRPSGHLSRIQKYLEDFAKSNHLDFQKDESGNVLISRPGNGRTVVLQGHQDMVPNSVSEFDFETTPLTTVIENGWVRAEGTTLGADDGSGIALMLCALTDPDLEGILLECLFTTDEETGLVGASNMKEGWLKGRVMVNLDNEDADEITIGSAGSTDVVARYSLQKSHSEEKSYKLRIEGLLGGHSAGMIDSGRANAILLTAGFLSVVPDVRV